MEERSVFPSEDLEIGDWFHAELTAAFGLETERWARESVDRVMRRLNAERPGHLELAAEILWLQQMNAFAVPGRYVYISRTLLERLDGDDLVAFVLAHEIAHHDLGHVTVFRPWLARLRHAPVQVVIGSALRLLERQWMGPEKERDTDVRALYHCIAAGCEGRRCIEALEILEAYLLDHGDIDGVFGPETLEGDSMLGPWFGPARRWAHDRWRGYPPLRARVELLDRCLRDLEARAASGT